MANRVPLTLNTSSSTIEELPSGDNLELAGSNIANVGNISSSGNITASVDITATGNIIGNYMLGNGALLTGIVSSPGGSNTQIQYNNAGSFGGVANLTFDGSNISLGPVDNLKISGGSNNQYLKTDGSGNMSFATITADSYMLKPVRAATTGNIVLSGEQVLDSFVAVVTGDRVLVWCQTDAKQNGVYIVSTGAWTRAPDFDTGAATLAGGVAVVVREGGRLSGVTFLCTNITTITIGTTSIAFDKLTNRGLISIWSPGLYNLPASASGNSGAMAIGVSANAAADSTVMGYSASSGSAGVSIGYGAVAGGTNGVAIGASSITSGDYGTAVGRFARAVGYGVSVGVDAGRASGGSPGTFSVNIGRFTGYSSSQGPNTVAIGHQAAFQAQKENAVAIGYNAGYTTQGINSVAIGANAGYSSQANNSIVLNATGANLNVTTANTLTIKPIREALEPSVLYYDSSSGEVTHSPMTMPTYTVSGKPASGSVGQMICITDSTPGGMMAYWDTTNSRWSYVHDNSAV